MTAVPPPRLEPVDDDSTSVPVTLLRLEAKVDVALAQQGAAIANQATTIADHETRIRTVEAKPTVSPRALWSGVCGSAGLLAVILPLIERLYSLHP